MPGTVASHMSSKALGVNVAELYQPLDKVILAPVSAGEKLEVIAAPNEILRPRSCTAPAVSQENAADTHPVKCQHSSPRKAFSPGTERFSFVLEGSVVVQIDEQGDLFEGQYIHLL
jgi:hypothetical protein